ncbi:MAG: hypothetical protein LBV26_03865 [Bacteroidales bacterium]|jgi:outer membrane protein X|nr:hypothetical protein [Bacteroidales bacterium]
MKKILCIMLLAAMATGAFAQEQGKIRGGLDFGYCIPKGGGGVCFDLQLGYNLKDNMTVGIKYGNALMGKVDPMGENASISANGNFLGTYTYYFSSGGSSFAPFVGGGLGMYTLASFSTGASSYTVDAGGKFGGALTAGFEAGKFRMALEYNLVPSSGVTVTDNSVTLENTSIKNSYLAVTVGFYIGGGKWKK